MLCKLIPVIDYDKQDMCMADLLASRNVSASRDFSDAERAKIKSLLVELLNKDTDERTCIDLKKVKLKINSAGAGYLLWIF